MERRQYIVPLEELERHISTHRVPKNAIIHYWYETGTSTKERGKTENGALKKKSWKDTPIFGMWADREEMEDVSAYVREIRKPRFTPQ